MSATNKITVLEEITIGDLFLADHVHFTRKNGWEGEVENLHVHVDGTVTVVLKVYSKEGSDLPHSIILHCQPDERVVLERTVALDTNAVTGLADQ